MAHYIDRLIHQFSSYVDHPPGSETYNLYKHHLEVLLNPNTKRLLFDSKQALVFSESGEVPEYIQSKLKTPFDQFYLEFTEPIAVGENEQGHFDYMRALYCLPNMSTITIPQPDGDYTFNAMNLIWFLHEFSPDKEMLIERGYQFSLEAGLSITRAESATKDSDPSEVPWGKKTWIVAGLPIAELPERHIGWWERVIQDYSALFSWVIAYTMAKSVVIVEESLSRQQRRWFESHPNAPRPWHIVKVEPKFSTAAHSEESPSHHSFRYDVIGHLRFAHHKLRNGEDYHGIEWVRPHQRGLENALYIPKTYKVEKGKVVSPRMREYFKPNAQQEGA